MKAILKIIDPKKNLDYEQPFNSAQNITIRQELVPELCKSLKKFHPSVNQVTKWLNCLHKSRRSQLKLKKSEKYISDLRRTHNNNRVHAVSIILVYWFYYLFANLLVFILEFLEKNTSY